MSKQRPEKPVQKITETPAEKPQLRTIEEYRHCPVCWNGNGGYGTAYSTHGRTRYYKCDKCTKGDRGPCGHTWTVEVKLEVIKVEHRIVKLDGER
jgi:hypothetical protein